MPQPPHVIALTLAWVVAVYTASAQHGAPAWTRAYGGARYDRVDDLVVLPNGDFIAVGATSSLGPSGGEPGSLTEEAPVPGDIGQDVLVARFDATGAQVWERRVGGIGIPGSLPIASYDVATSVAVDAAGDIVVAGTSNSAPDPTNPSAKQAPNLGDTDVWVIKLDPSGVVVWDQTYGASGIDQAAEVVVLANGNYLVTGTQNPDPNTGTSNNAADDVYVLQITPVGTVVREDTYGGASYERVWSTLQLSDGSVIVGAGSASMASPTTGKDRDTYGRSDIYLVHLDPDGAYLRNYQFGSELTEQPFAMAETSDGNVFVAAESFQSGSDVPAGTDPATRDLQVTGPLGAAAERDVYYVAFTPDASGAISYDGVYGGAGYDYPRAAIPLPNGCVLLGGETKSVSRAAQGSDSAPAGDSDAWLVYVNGTGEVTADISRGGAGNEFVGELQRFGDGSLLIGGVTKSGPFEWNEDGNYVGPLPDPDGIFFARLACAFEVTLPGDESVCEGESLDLANANEPDSDACMDWSWTDADGNLLGGQPAYTHTATATETITLTSTGPDGCERSDDILVEVQPGPTPVVSNVSEPTCDDANGSFDVSAPGATSIIVELLDPATTYTQAGDDVSFAGLPAGSYLVRAIVPGSACSPEIPFALASSTPGRAYELSTRDSDYCLGETIELLHDFAGLGSYEILAPDGVTVICDETSPGGCAGAAYTPTAAGTLEFVFAGAEVDGCAVSGAHAVTVHAAPTLSVTPEPETCGDAADGSLAVVTDANELLVNGVSYPAPGPVVGLPPDDYTVTAVSTLERCSVSELVTVLPGETFPLSLGDDLDVLAGQTVTLTTGLDDTSAYDITWMGIPTDCPACAVQTFIVPGDLEVTVSAVSASGCEREDRVLVNGREDRRVFVPTAFSPNGDSRNDVFEPILTAFVASTGNMRVFDRWGNTVYLSAEDPDRLGAQRGWDGTHDGQDATTGVYTYVMPITFINGETRLLQGDVTLLR